MNVVDLDVSPVRLCPLRHGRQPVGCVAAPWHTGVVIREPAEVTIADDGRIELPMGLLVEAGLNIGDSLLAFSEGDGRIVVRRAADALAALMNGDPL